MNSPTGGVGFYMLVEPGGGVLSWRELTLTEVQFGMPSNSGNSFMACEVASPKLYIRFYKYTTPSYTLENPISVYHDSSILDSLLCNAAIFPDDSDKFIVFFI